MIRVFCAGSILAVLSITAGFACSSATNMTNAGGGAGAGAPGPGQGGAGNNVPSGGSNPGGGAPSGGGFAGNVTNPTGGAPPIGGNTGNPSGGSSGMAGGGGMVILPPGNRCVLAEVTVAQGTTLLIDDIEDGNFDILPADGRDAAWFASHDLSPGSQASFMIEPTSAGAPNSTQAIHYNASGLDAWGAVLGFPLNLCYDATAYQGFSFWIKGNPDANGTDQIKLSLHTPVSEPEESGGACKPASENCYDHFAADIFTLPATWQRYTFQWSQFTQGGWGTPAPPGFVPQTNILAISFSPVYPSDMPATIPDKSFDIWVDEVSFDLSGNLGGGFATIVSQGVFDSILPVGGRHGLYANAYNDLVSALSDPRFSLFAREGTADEQRREAAAFLANIGHESGDLQYAEEIQANCASPGCVYCVQSGQYPCVPGLQYYGRGPMQLTSNENYGSFSEFLGIGKDALLSAPQRVAQEGPLTWKAALWYWIEPSNAHKGFLQNGFGATIRAINGALECDGGNPAQVASRLQRYRNACAALGVSTAGTDTGC